jgi:hypothetical protein
MWKLLAPDVGLGDLLIPVQIKKNADCRQKEKKTGGDEEGRSRLMPKSNEILQQVYKMFHPP